MPKLKKASTVATIYQALRQERHLAINELDEFYQNTAKARGDKPRSQMARLLKNNPESKQHLLFAGYRGCGKSTELTCLEKEIQQDFLVFNYSVFEDLDPMSINYIELIIITMEKLFEYVNDNKLTISKYYIESISKFLQIKEIQYVNDKYIGLQSEVGANSGLDIPFLFKFFTKFRISAKSSRSMKEVLKSKVEPHFATLLDHCNDLIGEIKLNLKNMGKKDLVIIIEDLDKIKLAEAENLFFNYAKQITSIKTNIIYTYPIALLYNIKYNQIRNLFNESFELPMIKVAEKDGTEAKQGIETMRKIVKARMDLNLFENESILTDFIKLSGGCIRDLFSLISQAAESCQDDEEIIINAKNKQYAINSLKRDYRNTIADHINNRGEVDITANQYYDVLIELLQNPKKSVRNTVEAMHLRQNLTILGYNGEGWCDVHPIVKQNIKDQVE